MINRSPYQILVRPVITEKALKATEKSAASGSQYTFVVAPDAGKREIKWAVETAYGVKVAAVNTVVKKGRNVYSRKSGTLAGKKSDVKKAVVTLAAGQTIEVLA